jgi:hypothetical protein
MPYNYNNTQQNQGTMLLFVAGTSSQYTYRQTYQKTEHLRAAFFKLQALRVYLPSQRRNETGNFV